MSDTQWPRYIVLHQDKEGNPHKYAGSVHAPDAELALLNARDVFVRRPECTSLWVVRADRVAAKTAEELEAAPLPLINKAELTKLANSLAEEGIEPYYVFQKLGPRGVHTYIGEVKAGSSEQALSAALSTFSHTNVTVWWVFPIRYVRKSTPEDIQALFAIAETKPFRDQGEYHTVATLRRIKDEKKRERGHAS